jgi:uncharacterized protein
MCKGNCPGTAVDGDWRNRTEHCGVWKAVYGTLEVELIEQGHTPISNHPLRAELERAHLDAWARGSRTTMAAELKRLAPAPVSPGSAELFMEIRRDLEKLRRWAARR